MDYLLCVATTGIGATALTDAWAVVRKHLFRVPPPNYSMVGRWIGHMPSGRFRHDSIAAAPRIAVEGIVGWAAHYLIGIAYAALLFVVAGAEWFRRPTLGPALIVGVATVAAPFFLMQPGMGAGIAASRTAAPNTARIHSVAMHTVFGLGLYEFGRITSSLVFN